MSLDGKPEDALDVVERTAELLAALDDEQIPGRRSASDRGSGPDYHQNFGRGERTVTMAYTWQYYDLVLGAIFASMVAGVAVGQLTPLATTTTVTGGAFVAVLLVGHGLFVNGPVDEPADMTDEVDALN